MLTWFIIAPKEKQVLKENQRRKEQKVKNERNFLEL
jgi:hypothetical protein